MQEDKASVKILLYFSVILNVLLAVGLYFFYQYKVTITSPIVEKTEEKDLSLQKYSYTHLREQTFSPEEMEFGPVLEETEEYVTRMFYYEVEGKKVSGLAHFPVEEGDYPVLVMLRGYVDANIYEPGIGTSPSARYFSGNGYITLAPDYLGYGESDTPPIEPFADRLISYPTVLQLLANIEKLDSSFSESHMNYEVQEDNVGIWAHSNGGQIALSVLETVHKEYPTVLWAPVSKPFPYSVLYFTDEFDDNGRYLRRLVADFEEDYDIESFSLTNYLEWIDSPIQIHQGAKDDAVPLKWSDQLYQAFLEHDIDVEYFTYEEADHNLRPDWDTAIERTLEFFDTHIRKDL